jgi:hypothetical protein
MKKDVSEKTKDKIVIYQTKSGSIELKTDISKETIWANLNQIAHLFSVQKSAVSKHIKNIFETGELAKKATVSKMETVQKEGKREVIRSIEMYNLDMIIAVGYRVNSKNATQFRIWATKTLREFLTKGFVINKKQIQKNHSEFLRTIESIQNLLPEHTPLDPKTILELVKEFSSTWKSLDEYDRDALQKIGSTKKSVSISTHELLESIDILKNDLIKKSEATDIICPRKNSWKH